MTAGPPMTQDELIATVRLWWYAIALVPILLLVWLAAIGWMPIYTGMAALFLFLFWLISLLFVVALKISARRRRK